ncbi:ABC transporter permease subunit [Mycoplasma hafezii]|uniref:ABC transporter permease subunit n=1 Tax=Mycoplasma hafezii TaxID=525886 RepID=UPI003CE86F89
MEKLKLYNWYGETFDAKLPESSNNLKAYKHQVDNVFTRLTQNIKTRNEIEKELFLRAKQKINDNLKRELNSHKVAYKNKIKVYKDSITKLKFADNIVSLLKFELTKLEEEKSLNKKYIKDFIISLENSADEYEFKVDSIQQLQVKSNQTELEIFKKYALYHTLYLYLKAYQVEGMNDFDWTKIKDKLAEFEINVLSKSKNPNQLLKDIYDNLEQRRQNLLRQKETLLSKYKAIAPLQKEIYKKERKNIILQAQRRIVELENEYNLKTQEAQIKADEYKQEALAKIQAHKEQILATEKHNKEVTAKVLAAAKKRRSELKQEYPKYLNIQVQKLLVRNKRDFLSFVTKEKIVDSNQKSFLALTNEQLDQEILALEQQAINNQTITKYNMAKDLFFKSSNISEIAKEAKLISKSVYAKALAETYKAYSYEYEYKLEEATAYREYFIDNYKTRIKFLHEKITANLELLELKLNNAADAEKTSANRNFAKINQEYSKQIEQLKARVKSKEISDQAFKNKKNEFEILRREKINEVKLQSTILKNKEILNSSDQRKRAEKKVNKKIFESKINEAVKSIPVETNKNLKIWAPLLGFLVPGLPEIIWFRQNIKGTLMLILTAFLWLTIIPFSLGWYGYPSSNGIFGLWDLGADAFQDFGIKVDSRLWLFVGVLSVLFLTLTIIYSCVAAIGARRVAISLYQGSRPSKWSHTKRWLNTSGFPWLISLFGWLLMLFVVISPVLTSILLSFTNYGYMHEAPQKPFDWVGLEQWGKWWAFREVDLLGSIGNVFGWTIIWTICSTFFPIALGILIAILANNPRVKGRKFFRIVFIIPWAVPAFVTLSFIKNMFAPGDAGFINYILAQLFGLKARSWLTEIGTTRILVIIVQTWIGYAYIFMLVTGTLQSVPKDIYEAGSVDGAKSKHLFIYLTMPTLLISIAPMLIGQFVAAFNNFTTISIFTGGGPAFPYATVFGEGSTDIIISWVYKLTTGSFKIEGNQAFAAALITLASLVSVAFAARGFIKSMSRRD